MFQGKMNLSMKVLQALHKAEEQGATITTMADVAEAIDGSESYTEQAFSVLNSAKLVKGKKGPGGGYCLVKDKAGSVAYAYQLLTLKEFMELDWSKKADTKLLTEAFLGMTLAQVVRV
jgi:predicted transcriptional regulator